MKFFIFPAAFLFFFQAHATVRTVSNNPATIAQFSTIQAAINASADGDSVYVHGSPNSYATFDLTDKRLTIIGPGWGPDKDLPLTANVDGCRLSNTAAAGDPSGSELQRIIFNAPATLVSTHLAGSSAINNIRIIRCQFNHTFVLNQAASGWLVEGCIFYYQMNYSGGQTYQNFLLQNNMFFYATCCTGNSIKGLSNSVNVRFDHNIFFSNAAGAPSTVHIFGSNCRFLTLTNNIFNYANGGENVSFSTYNNNITNNATLDPAYAVSNATPWAVNSNVDGGGNVSNQNPQMVGQASINAGNSSPHNDFTIPAGPANESGGDGKDMGLLFDATGSLNWLNSRNSRLPRIYKMNIINSTVATGGNISVSVEARTSN